MLDELDDALSISTTGGIEYCCVYIYIYIYIYMKKILKNLPWALKNAISSLVYILWGPVGL